MKKPLTISIEEKVKKKLETLAQKEKRSLSNLVEILLEEAIRQREHKQLVTASQQNKV